MKNNPKIRVKLEQLLDKGQLPAAQLEKPAYFATILKQLLTRKLIQKVSLRVGQWSYRVMDETALAKLAEKYQNTVPVTMDKVVATQIAGDAHAANEIKYPSVPLRALNPGALIHTGEGGTVDAYEVCKHGLALYLPINETLFQWCLNGTICLVENQRYFWEADQVFPADFYLYLQGNFSNRIVDWLSSSKMENNSFVYFGDYEPAGIRIYLRLKKCLPDCQFFIPDNFEELLDKYGNKYDLTKQHRDFSKLLESDDKDIIRIRQAFEKTGRTLHQEALLIKNDIQ